MTAGSGTLQMVLAPLPASAIIAAVDKGAFDPAHRFAYAMRHLTTSKVSEQ